MNDASQIKEAIKTAQSYDDVLAICNTVDVPSLTTEIARKLLRVLRRYKSEVDNPGPNKKNTGSVRIAYLGNITFEPLPDYVEIIAACRGLSAGAYIGGYDQYIQELINDHSGLSEFAADVIFINLVLRELAPEVVNNFSNLNADQVNAAREMILEKAASTVRLALDRHQAMVLVSNFPAPNHFHLGIADQKQAYSESEFYADLNLEMKKRFKDETRAQIFDMEQLVSSYGKINAFDEKLYYLAKVPWQESFYLPVADQLVRHVAAASGQAKKCLVLDLDNTLWGGVLGESGVHGVKVGHGDGESEAFYDFQCKIRSLKNRGILLGVCSKNNMTDVEEVFSLRTDMPLKLEDFSVLEVSWDMKHEGLSRIADKLNIGLDSIVFVDDNPAECELIYQMLPQVETILLPNDPSVYPALLDFFYGFDKAQITSEDQAKSRQYAEGADRVKHQASFKNLESYLESLQTEITIALAGEQEKMRAHQLFSKTNQFNVTTKRYSMAEVESLVERDSCDLYTVQASDRFGDLGIIGLCLVDNANQGTAFIDSFILSCRAMGRGIETAVINFIKEEYFGRRGVSNLDALFVPTNKNMPAQQFYLHQGFEAVNDGSSDECRYTLLADNSSILNCHWVKVDKR
jgi:FkbH-like protein